jgi:hypothetical protein
MRRLDSKTKTRDGLGLHLDGLQLSPDLDLMVGIWRMK